MNDQDFKRLFQAVDHGKPSDLDIARWRKAIHHQLRIGNRSSYKWQQLAVACLVGFSIGAATTRGFVKNSSIAQKSDDSDATVERIYVNTQ